MKVFALVVVLCAVASLVSAENAEACDTETCVAPDCQCAQMEPPIEGDIPQLVALSFDDSAAKLIYESFYEPVLFNRKNPDGCPISGTFFVPHEYSDYTVVNSLYNHGFQIGSHSITKNYSSAYWNNASSKTIEEEMGGQKQIIAKFANIPIGSILGARIPNFQLNNDETYNGLKNAGFLYDNSWPTYSFQPFFPYTLDYMSEQSCLVGSCPTTSIPGFWIIPIINWVNQKDVECNKLLACDVSGTESEIFDWLMENFNNHYKGNRAPFSILLNSAWFNFTKNSFEALKKFLDTLASKEDVFLVSEKQIIDWMKNPVTTDKYSSCTEERPVAKCSPVNCKLQNSEGNDRYMGSCIKCPKRYPGLGNPEGSAKK